MSEDFVAQEVDDVLARLHAAAQATGTAVVRHLADMYPAALAAVTPNARRSLRGFVHDRVYGAMRPLVDHAARIAAERTAMLAELDHLRARVRKLEDVIAGGS